MNAKIAGILADVKALHHFVRERRIRREPDVARVVFLCQYIPAWNKVQPVYEIMKEDPRFEAFLVCVPSGIRDQELADPDLAGNDVHEYFTHHGYGEAIDAFAGRKWLGLQELEPDYVFYPRPYNSFMPKPYTSNHVSRYSKICCLMYGMELSKPLSEVLLNKDFFRNVHCYFAEDPYMQRFNRKQLWLTHKLGLQKSVCCGTPALAWILNARGEANGAWDFSKNKFRVMWTPRWTSDPALGGTNFFLYKDDLLTYAKEHGDMDLLLRPHPLMFDNFTRTGEMTAQEVEEYRDRVGRMANVSFDREQEYGATFWGTDVLISDTSGILPEFFLTGKPLIFCASNMTLELKDTALRMLEGCYVAETKEDLFAYLNELKEGRDRLFGKRQEIIAELFGDVGEAAGRVVEELARRGSRKK